MSMHCNTWPSIGRLCTPSVSVKPHNDALDTASNLGHRALSEYLVYLFLCGVKGEVSYLCADLDETFHALEKVARHKGWSTSPVCLVS